MVFICRISQAQTRRGGLARNEDWCNRYQLERPSACVTRKLAFFLVTDPNGPIYMREALAIDKRFDNTAGEVYSLRHLARLFYDDKQLGAA